MCIRDRIRVARGFKKVYLRSNLNLVGIPDGVLNGLDIIGETGNRKYTLTVTNVLVTDCKATNLTVTGAFKAGSTAQAIDCEIHDALNVGLRATNCSILSGVYESTDLSNCLLKGDIKIKENGNMSGIGIVFEGDFSTIDMQNATSTVSLDVDSGYFKLINAATGCLAEFNLRGGEIEIDSTCTGGEYYLEGYGTLFNNGSMIEKANHLLALETIPIPIWDEVLESTYTTGELLRLLASVNIGKTSILNNGNGTATVTFKGIDGITNRVIAQMDGSERVDMDFNL